ncbi:hypothetical protein T4B_2941 [Trichinella pseudospiralis]|uniref:Uncharacterized protein n=1 Tax=Trichinella pseudospiralis TaxID=6337 RepID=A0A0V1DZP8_TRIPS|nr:hypothetical protein T4A_3535 [Trichinella pseudospiralis]KRZ10363.1 hypothetical protein T4B_2941 [Trichinella pseudospiralis]KRZ42894.1 hypothetical protein T4C_3285 [Trichinella pseudospiralis]
MIMAFSQNDPGTDVAGFCELSMCHGNMDPEVWNLSFCANTSCLLPTLFCKVNVSLASSGASCHKVSVRSVPAVVSPHARRRPSLGNQNLPVSATSNSAERNYFPKFFLK